MLPVPEQIQKKATDARVDIFALGVVLWEALTGRRLFRARNDYETLVNVQEREIPPPSTLRPEIPAALDQVALKACSSEILTGAISARARWPSKSART